jgi:hypothetical protein
MEQKAKDIIIQSIPTLKAYVEKFSSYQVAKIDLERLLYFISQFDSYERINIIIRLIEKIDFIDSTRMTFLLKNAYNKIPSELLKQPLISSLGSIQDSSAVVCYQLLKYLFDNEGTTLNLISDVNSIGKNIESSLPSSIVFFDDNITSGTQLTNFFEELIDGKEKSEQVKTPLTNIQYEIIKKIPIRICYAIQLAENSNEVLKEIKRKYGLDIDFYCGKVDYNNYLDYQSNTMNSESEAKFSRDFIREISEQLYDDKNWPNSTIYNRLLGYGNLGKLTVFYYNVPKSLIPVFWKFGYYNNKPWIPLFPETQEQKKIDEKKITFEYYQLEAIRSWISSVPLNRKPDLKFGLRISNDISLEISKEIPSIELIKERFKKYIFPKKQEYELNKKSRATLRDLNTMLEDIYPTSKLNDNDYYRYKNAIDEYNQQLEDYYRQLQKYIYQQSSNTTVVLEIANIGNIAATNCTVKLTYNSGEILLNDFIDLPKPTFNKEKPNLNDFDSSNRYARAVVSPSNFELPSILGVKKREPIEKNTDYDYKIFSNIRVGHNDRECKEVEITRMNLNCNSFRFQYEINFDEEAETIMGFITVNYVETENLNKKIEDEIFKSIDKLKK